MVAHGIASGSNPGLARKVMQRRADGGTVTQAWLDEVTAAAKSDEAPGEIKQLMVRLEQTLDTFSKNTTAARHATSNYGDELEQQVADLASVQQTGQIISTLADLAKAMLEKTRSLEAEMRTSESEAKGLCRSLEKAQRDAEVDHLTGLPNRRASKPCSSASTRPPAQRSTRWSWLFAISTISSASTIPMATRRVTGCCA